MSGFQGGDFYTHAGMYSGQTANNMRYRSQLAAGMQVDPAGLLSPSTVGKRSLAELHQQQQALFLRSVKQRAQTSPISPLSPISPELSTASSSSSARSFCYPIPPRQQLLPTSCGVNTTSISLAGVNLRQSSPDSKMMNRLIELERQLLDDDENDGSAAASAVTNSEWSETMQSLMIPIPLPPQQKSLLSQSPTSSSSSSSSSATTIAASTAKQQLMEAAVAVSEGNLETATAILNRLKQVSGAAGNPDQRLNDYLLQSLLSRLNLNPNPPESSSMSPVAELFGNEHLIATQMLFEASPCFKLGFMAANLAILEATQNHAKIHILDFEIGQGNQYVTLINALGERQISPALKITAVSDPSFPHPDGIRAVGDRLTKHADRVGVGFRFNVVCRKVSDLSREAIRHEDGEALAVNFAFRLFKMPDESVSTANPRDELLRSVKSLGPRIVTLVEQEMNANTAPFLTRFNEAQAYYGALFDSLDTTMARDGPDRTRIEECLSRKAINSVAREGQERVERCEVFGKWRARMGMAGFEPKPLSANIAEPLQAKLASRPNPGFFLKEEAGGLFFGWKGRVLTVASAWR